MPITVYNPKSLPKAVGPFARAIRIGDFLYISGTSALTHIPGPIWERELSPDFETQARLTFQNIQKVVEDAGGTMANIFKTTAYLKDRKNYDTLNKVRAEFLPGGRHVSSGFITSLIREEMQIEIEAQAYFGS